MSDHRRWLVTYVPVAAVAVVTVAVVLFSSLNLGFRDTTLSDKEYLLSTYPKVIFAGDSRAAFQLNPLVAAKALGLDKGDVVNIGGGHGDLVAVDNLAQKYPEIFQSAILVVSVSLFQMNEGARDPHYYPAPMMARMTLWEQLTLFFPSHLDTLVDYYRYSISGIMGTGLPLQKLFPETNGYTVATHDIDVAKMHTNAATHPWYKKFDLDGRKARYFEEALVSLKPRVKALFIYTGAFAPVYIAQIRNEPIYRYEQMFQAKVAGLCAKHGISFRNFSEETRLPADGYADEMHLNDKGADVFTRIVVEDFGIQKLLRRRTRVVAEFHDIDRKR